VTRAGRPAPPRARRPMAAGAARARCAGSPWPSWPAAGHGRPGGRVRRPAPRPAPTAGPPRPGRAARPAGRKSPRRRSRPPPRPACVPSSGRPGCRGPPRSRWSGARSSGRSGAGSRNSQSQPHARPLAITRATLSGSIPLNSGGTLQGYPAGRQAGAYTPSSRRQSNPADSAGYNIFTVQGGGAGARAVLSRAPSGSA